MSGIVNQFFYQKTYDKVMNSKITGFNIYYSDNVDSDGELNQKDETVIRDMFKDNRAYSFVDGIRTEKLKGVPIIIGVGAFGRAYGYPSSSEITAFKGSNIKNIEVGENFSIGNTNVVIKEELPFGASFFRKAYLNKLDDCILVIMPYSKFETLFTGDDLNFYKMLIRTNLNLIDASDSEVEDITNAINNTKQNKVIPISYNNYLTEQYNEKKNNIYFYTIIIISAFIFISYGVFKNLLNLVDKNITEYTVNILFGATIKDIFIRNFFYVMIIIGPSILISFFFINAVRIIGKTDILLQIAVIILISILVSLVPHSRISRNYLLNNLRRD
ncbi:hypothetical protein EHE19_016455 [Ruminiclostridium herbifermentans]|uniref:Uncharacterized protein n=2 Tax=Ruminiclostridium herbifermentans TaxID=2488810 RepID=A0A7H1VM24_9FIRM|nr:hypothetical protein EHE19_016455 [Ruminiclostridium herbifermentans]